MQSIPGPKIRRIGDMGGIWVVIGTSRPVAGLLTLKMCTKGADLSRFCKPVHHLPQKDRFCI